VDGGNTSTIALVLDRSGAVVGSARGACSDIYGAASPEAAIAELVSTASSALSRAGVSPADLALAAFGLAGADWPEDFALLEDRLAAAFPTTMPPLVVNDAIGALWTGTSDGRGAAAACGTYAAIAASGDRGTWHTSFWVEPVGATPLAQEALRAVSRAELGTGPSTQLVEGMLTAGGFASVEAMLHRYTNRDRPPRAAIAQFAPVVFDTAEAGDAVAQALIEDQGAAAARSIQAAVVRAGIEGSYPLVLTGGLFKHRSRRLSDAIARALPDSVPVVTRVESVAGVALLAARRAGFPTDRDDTLAAVAGQTDILAWHEPAGAPEPVGVTS
jgi:N-acetylglucosamine kinase-like BadF-type ATPase